MFNILLILIFARPFIPSVIEFSFANAAFSSLLLIFLISWILVKGLPVEKIAQLKFPLILFCASLLVSLIFAFDRMVSLKELYKYITALLLFLIAASLSSEEKSLLIKGITFAAIFVSFLAIYQYFFGFKHLAAYITRNNITNPFILDYVSRKRVFSPFVTPNVLGGYLAMIIPLLLIDKKNLLLIIPLSLALLLTRSIGGFLSLFLGLGVYFYLQKRLGKKELFLTFAFFILIVLVLIARFAAGKEHLHPIFSAVMRLNYWQDALQTIKQLPLTGVGLGNFNIPYSRYAHNSYLQIGAEMGILGVVSLLWLVTSVFKPVFKNTGAWVDRNQTACLISANVVFLAHNFIDFTFFLPEVAIIWWIILGLILSKS